MASWAEDQERGQRFDDLLREEPGFRPDPKPVRADRDQRRWVQIVERLVNQREACQVCGMVWPAKGLSGHHIVSRRQGGDDMEENCAILCGHGTVGCHGDVEARRNNARHRLRRNMTLEQISYVLQKEGEWWLDRHYPMALEATEGMGSSDA